MKKILVLLLLMGLCVSAEASSINKNTKMGTGSAFVTTPGTPVALSGVSIPTQWVYVTAIYATANGNPAVSHDIDNGVYVGGANVNAGGMEDKINLTNRKGINVLSKDSVRLQAGDLSMIYVDSLNSGDGVSYVYFSD